jgi:hypothetical protein
MMTLRFGTDTARFGGRSHSFGGDQNHRRTAFLIRAVGNGGEIQPALFDLSSGVGGMRWSDKVVNLMGVLLTLRSWRQGLPD